MWWSRGESIIISSQELSCDLPAFCCLSQKKNVSGNVFKANQQTKVSCFAVKRYIRKGIPNEHRALIWMIVSGAQANMEQNPGYYHRLLEGEKNDKLVEAIKTGYCPDNKIRVYLLSYVLKLLEVKLCHGKLGFLQ